MYSIAESRIQDLSGLTKRTSNEMYVTLEENVVAKLINEMGLLFWRKALQETET